MTSAPPRPAFGEEIHLPLRPDFGRLERTRFNGLAHATEPFFAARFRRRLEQICLQLGATAIHAIPHLSDFVHGYAVARRLGLHYFLNVHDDLAKSFAAPGRHGVSEEQLAEIWRDSDARFTITEEMGQEYGRRYGERPFTVVTDALEQVRGVQVRPAGRLNIYFMGMFHLTYESNLELLLAALKELRIASPEVAIQMTLRCGTLSRRMSVRFPELRVLPFGSESEVEADLQDADLLYLPLPFGSEDRDFVRLSLSTKLITYLGSGLPILYHGPAEAAAAALLRENHAAFLVEAPAVAALAAVLRQIIAEPAERRGVAEAAGKLAVRQFMAADLRARFWDTISDTSSLRESSQAQPLGAEETVSRAISESARGLPQSEARSFPSLRRIFSEGLLYLCNYVVTHVPSHTVRLWFYRRVMGFHIAAPSYIFMGATFDCKRGFRMGHHSVINQDCRLDPRGGLEIGDYVSIAAEVCILTLDHDPQSSDFAMRAGVVRIEDYASIGTRAMILKGVTIGRGAMVAAGAVVVKSVPPYTIVAGCPAKVIGSRAENLTYHGSYDRLFH